jgi:hypothetical protein
MNETSKSVVPVSTTFQLGLSSPKSSPIILSCLGKTVSTTYKNKSKFRISIPKEYCSGAQKVLVFGAPKIEENLKKSL